MNDKINKDTLADFVSDKNRLQVALQVLGVNTSSPKHHRHVLVSQISQYAAVNGDSSLEQQCETLLAQIRSE